MTDQEIRLKFGEMNAGEMRLARALVAWHEREIARLKAEREKWEADALRYCKNADFWRSEHDKAQDELAALQTENIRLKKELAHQLDMGGQAAVCAPRVALDEVVRRMEAVPVRELWDIYRSDGSSFATDSMGAVRARLIAAAKGEGQAQPVVVNEPPKSEGQPDLSGESEKQPDEPATFEAHGKTWTRHTPGDPMPCDGEAWVNWLLESEFNGSFPYRNNSTLARNLGKFWTGIIGWRYADEPAQAEQATAQPWTPTVGDTVRLKSGGPMMTVTGVDPLSLMCAWMNADDELQVEPITTLCLEPAQP